jgi:large subunit ribosomal protein L24
MTSSHSTQPRKQRRAGFRASTVDRHRRMSVALSRELRARYGRRNLPLRKGDTVRVVSGSHKGREERISDVDLRGLRVTLDNVTTKKGDQKLKPLPLRPSHLILTRLNLADPWRREILKVPESEAPPAEPEATIATEPAPDSSAPAATESDAPEEPTTADTPSAAPAQKRRARPAASKESA